MNVEYPSLKRVILALSIIVLLLPPGAWTATWFVDKDNTENVEDGATWATAFTTIQPAIDAAATGGEGEVWVAEGLYDEERAILVGTGEEGDGEEEGEGPLAMREGVHLYGGFAGNETTRSQRDWQTHATIIAGPSLDQGDRVRHVIVGADNSTLDGFTITGGGKSGQNGGGMYNSRVSPVVRNCIFEDNLAFSGGAVYNVNSEAEFINCDFRANSARHGGAVHNVRSQTHFVGCHFIENFTFSDGTHGIDFNENAGGALCSREGSTIISNCTFVRNSSIEGGGAIFASVFDEASTMSISNSIFDANTAGSDGGAILIAQRFTTDISTCAFSNNVADGDGGALFIDKGALTLSNSSFWGNSALVRGGVFFGSESNVSMTNCTFWNNTSLVEGGAIFSAQSELTVLNSDFWDNSPDSFSSQGSSPDVRFSILQRGFEGTNNIDAMPLYRNPNEGDFRPLPNSPTIDAGTEVANVPLDFRGFPRPQGLMFDIGVSEFYDSDGDDIENDWELRFGLDPDDPSDGPLDPDGDGLSNQQEFVLDTDPLDGTVPSRTFYVSAVGDDLGEGSVLSPWRTLERATTAASIYTNASTIVVGAGIYEESLVLPPNVTLQGAGPELTRIQNFNSDSNENIVVDMGNNSAVLDCLITLPGLHTSVTTLVRIADVSAVLDNVILDGGDNLFSIAVLVSGENSSGGVIRNSTIRRVQFGIHAVGSGINIHDNVFEGIREDAIFVRLPDSKSVGSTAVTPQLGMADEAGTGHNEFRSIGDSFIVNLSNAVTTAELNDWGLFNELDIAAKMVGSVDFLPFLDADETPIGDSEGLIVCAGATGIRQSTTLSAPAGDLIALFIIVAPLALRRKRYIG